MSALMRISLIRGQANGKPDCTNFESALDNSNPIRGPGSAIKMLQKEW